MIILFSSNYNINKMLRIAQTKNTLLDGATIAEQLYTTPKDCEEFFESIEKPTEVVAAPRSTCR